jgi:hypothetical protein
VRGWVGSRPVDARVRRTPEGIWTLGEEVVAGLDGCVDLDFGFTPATNLIQLRRVGLRVGEAADVPVAWFDGRDCSLTMLHQSYERRTAETYWYEAARFDYSALLHVNAVGFVETYPGLWQAEA